MINYFLLLDENQTTDQKVVSSNPAECASFCEGLSFITEVFFCCLKTLGVEPLSRGFSSPILINYDKTHLAVGFVLIGG